MVARPRKLDQGRLALYPNTPNCANLVTTGDRQQKMIPLYATSSNIPQPQLFSLSTTS